MTPDVGRVAPAVDAIRAGRMVVVIDDPERENEGDLVMAGQFATAEAVNFMARFGRGLICVPMTPERLRRLSLEQMVERPEDSMRTAFTVSVDAREGTTTGISAADRCRTIQVLANPASRPEDLMRPGHVFPLEAKPGGVLKRPGHTEAAVDLCRLAGVEPVGVICEILRDDGTMMRADELVEFSARHGLPVLFIADLVRFRLGRETLVAKAAESRLETEFGPFMVAVYEEGLTGQGHLALTLGSVDDGAPVLVRVHSECVTGDALGATACSCRRDLAAAMAAIQREGRGVLLYMQPEHRTAGLIRQIRAYADGASAAVGPEPHPELRPDLRDIGAGAAILADLGVHRLRLLTNHPRPYPGLEGYGLTVEEFVPLPPAADAAPVAPRQKGVL